MVDIVLEKLTDTQLLGRYLDGDENAFRELVTRYKNGLYTFLRQFLYRDDHIDDVFQETFLQLFYSLDSFNMNRPLRPWLFTIAANKAKDAIRKLQQKREISIGIIADSQELSFNRVLNIFASDDSTPTVEFEKNEYALLVKEVISVMPVSYKEILLLAYFNEFSYKQIANKLNIPLGTVKSRLHSSIRYFGKLWREYAF